MFVIVLRYLRPIEEVDRLLAEHRAYLARYYDQGVFLLSGPRTPRTGGVILADGVERATLDRILAEDPFQQAGVTATDVIAFTPVGRSHPDLARFLPAPPD
ncbi:MULTISPECIES: YciI family protein [Frankia]|uniref:YciI family protein n=1 Tax=Frankia TaxID=1854 RepID=UPI0002DF2F54|nr:MULTISPECIES: YciI family protein [Frankia]